METFVKDRQYFKFSLYGFLKNLRFFEVFLLVFFLENGISFSQIGILYAAREIMSFIAEIPSGIIADIYGRKQSLLLAFVLYILSFVVFYFSHNFFVLLIAIILIGIGDAFRSGSHKGMIMDYLKIKDWEKQKIAYYGHTRSWSQIGSAVSAIIGGIVVFYTGSYRYIYLFSIVPYLLNFFNIYTYPKELNFSLKKTSTKNVTFKSVFLDVIKKLKKKRVFELVNSSALHSAFLKSIKDYIQPLMINIAIILPFFTTMDLKNKSGLTIGIIYFFIFLISSYASKVSGNFRALKIKRIDKKTLLLGLISGICCGLFYHYEYWFISLLIFVLIFVVENFRKPILIGFLADNVPNEILTSVISSQSFYKTIVTVILSLMIGTIADIYGIGISLSVISIVLLLLTIVIDVRIRKLNPEL